MIKLITIITKFTIVTIIALLLTSCRFEYKTNDGIIPNQLIENTFPTTEKREVNGDFKNIQISDALHLVLEQFHETEIIVEADDNMQNSIITEVHDNTLIISLKNGEHFNIESTKITIKTPNIEQLIASSAATINTKNTLIGENISLITSNSAKIEADLEVDQVSSKSSSASTIIITGLALNLQADASTSSTIDATNLFTNAVIAKASSAGKISTHPIVNLEANASSNGRITYSIVPKYFQKNTSSGGSIHEK